MAAITVSHASLGFRRFSVRGLIVFVLFIGVGLGWIVRAARIQRDAVAAIRRDGGSVEYKFDWLTARITPGAEPAAVRWLVDLIGIDYFGHVTAVSFTDRSGVEIADIRELSPLVDLRTGVKDLTNLERLDLFGKNVSDAALINLKGLSKLSELNLIGSPVSDAGLAHLKGLVNLSVLRIGSTDISDSGLAQLKTLTNLSELYLFNTNVTDTGLTHLKELPKLALLDLRITRVSDAGLVHLKELTKLAVLHLTGARVTDNGMKQLEDALPGLVVTTRRHLIIEP
jgi:internalin A